MKLKRIIMLVACMASLSALSACTEAKYAAHVVKQIPFPGEQSETQGSFKVGNTYAIKGRQYYPEETYHHSEIGTASWYGPGFHGKKTANGEIFDKNELTAAHRTLQMPSIIRVTNLDNGRSVLLRVNDRGPFAHDRILDVSERGATLLGFKNNGTAKIKMEVMGSASQQVAERAKAGYDTRGYEVALNQGRSNSYAQQQQPAQAVLQPISRPEPVTQVALSNTTSSAPIPPMQPQQVQTISSAGYPIPPRAPVSIQPIEAQSHMQTQAYPQQAQAVGIANPMPVETQRLSQPSYQNVAYQQQPQIPRQVQSNYVTASNVSNLAPGKIYVQAGSFSQEQNALSLSNQLAPYGQSKVYMTRVNNQPYFRVRLGPYEDQQHAREILTALNQSGNKNAVIIID